MIKRCPYTFGELPLVTGVLPRNDSEIRGAILRIAKTNIIFKHPRGKLPAQVNKEQIPKSA